MLEDFACMVMLLSQFAFDLRKVLLQLHCCLSGISKESIKCTDLLDLSIWLRVFRRRFGLPFLVDNAWSRP
jgi:hypothetical protein